MTRITPFRRIIAFALVSTLALAACAPSAAPPPTAAGQAPAKAAEPAAQKPAAEAKAPAATGAATGGVAAELDAYYQKARASGETKVTHYGLGTEYEPLAKAFQQKFPGIQMEPVPMRGAEMIQRINAERASGKVVANVAGTGVTTTSEIERQGHYVQWRPPTADLLPTAEGGTDNARWMFTVSLFGIVVNTSLVPADKIPTKRPDLLDPFFKGPGKLFSADPRQAGGGQSFWVLAYDDLGQEYLDKIKAQDITFTRDADAAPAQVARGEFALYFAAGVNEEILELERTAPVKMHFFRDGGAHFTDITAGVIKDAPGQDAAKLWVSWLTSDEGQREMVEKVKVYPALPGIQPPGGWPTFQELKPKSRTAEHRTRNNEYISIFEKTYFQ